MGEERHNDESGTAPGEGLRRALDRYETPPAGAEFKERLRAMFVDGGSASAASDEPEPALAALLDQDSVPPARPEFEEDLWRRFVNVRRGVSRTSPVRSAPAVRSASRVRRTPPRVERAPRKRFRLLAGGIVAAAAAVVAFLFTQGVFTPSARWHALPGDYAELRIDGEPVAGLSGTELDRRLDGAKRVVTGGGALRMEYDGRFVLELGEESELGLERMPADADARDLVLVGDKGAFRVATGPAFAGTELRFATALFDALVTGTVFGIDVLDAGICLCVTEGSVELMTTGGATPEVYAVGEGRRRALDWQGRMEEEEPVCVPHAVPLDELARAWRSAR